MSRWLLAWLCVGSFASAEEVVVKLVSEVSRREAPSFEELWSLAADEMAWVVELRRELHRLPELMYNESVTAAKIAQVLGSLGVSFTTGWAKNIKHAELAAKGFASGEGGTGIVAEIGTGGPPCVLLRADIDALPIREASGLPFASESAGKMHACGHDAHGAMLVGAAALLKKREAALNGTVRLIWQPAEEGGAGGKRMVEEGVLAKEPRVGAAFGFHQWPFEPIGVVAGRPKTLMAATEIFDIQVSGVGGHAAMPHTVKDPIVAASHMVTSLQSIASRETSPLDAAVVSVTMFHAGSAYNVIPAGAAIGGTIRSLTIEGLQRLKSRVADVVQLAAAAHRCNVSVSWSADAYPPTVNDPALFDWVKSVAAEASTTGRVELVEPTMGGEVRRPFFPQPALAQDFSFIAQEVPAVFLMLGQGDPHWALPDDPAHVFDTTVGVHNPAFVLNENVSRSRYHRVSSPPPQVLQRGVALHAHLAMQWLASRA